MDELRTQITKAIGLDNIAVAERVKFTIVDSVNESDFTRHKITYGDDITAYLLIPDRQNNNPAILIHHQHNGERHLGKSEVCGLAGDPLQAFGPALAQKGFVVLAPDSICFEDRRVNGSGITPLPGDGDFLQHYNEMCYRILKGETLMAKVLRDAIIATSLLNDLGYVDKHKIGVLGHSYGGNTTIFHYAIDKRLSFGCASGSGCTYQNRMQNGTGIEMASVIPSFLKKFDIDDLVKLIAPKPFLLVSADSDKYSLDADFVFEQALPEYKKYGATVNIYHKRYNGGHALTQERFDFILEWICQQVL